MEKERIKVAALMDCPWAVCKILLFLTTFSPLHEAQPRPHSLAYLLLRAAF
jgi:hypothetical protein